MIPRYARPEAAAIWSPQTRFRIMFEIEAHAADAMAKLGVIPASAAEAIWKKGGEATFDVDRIDEIERETKHDVIAFLTHVTEIVGPEARFLHQGMTSSDVNDTALAVQLTRATDLLMEDVELVLSALKRRALEHRHTPTVGRSHGIHAEPTTFGLKLAGHYAEFARARERLAMARFEIATCAISGPVGTFASVDPAVEAHVAEKLGLRVEPGTPPISPPWPLSPHPSSGWRWRFVTCNERRFWRLRSLSTRARRDPRPCRISATRSSLKTSLAWRGWSAPR
jgi:adenylosuccinate lyase